MAIDPRHLRLVLAVVEHGTFNQASKALGISQPALSKNIGLLEQRLGTKIFERGARGVTLTDAGQVIARSASNVHHILERTREEIAANRKAMSGPIVVGATPSMMLGLVPEALSHLARLEPHFKITIREGLDDQLTPALLMGEIDLLVGPLASLRTATEEYEVSQIELAREPFCIGFAPSHRLASAVEVHLAELADESWILPTQGSSFHRTVEALFIAAGIAWPTDVIETNSLHAHERLVVMTGRVAIVTRAQLVSRRTDIRAVPLVGAPLRPIGVRRRHGIVLPPLADRFLEQLRQVISTSYDTSSLGAYEPVTT